MLGAVTGRPTEQRLAASVAAALLAAQRGARIVRVHDVAATVDVLKIYARMQRGLTVDDGDCANALESTESVSAQTRHPAADSHGLLV
jgi:hypothetical protein